MHVRRVPGDEAAPGPHARDHALLYPEHRDPGGRRHRDGLPERLRQLAAQLGPYRLRVVRVHRVRPFAGVLRVHDPPLAGLRERDQQQGALPGVQQVVGVAGERGVEDHVGVEPDAGRAAVQPQPEPVAYGAARAVRAHQPSRGELRRRLRARTPQPGRDLPRPRREVHQFRAPLDLDAQAPQAVAEHLLRQHLIHHQRVRVSGGQPRVVGVEPDERPAPHVQREVLDPLPPREQFVRQPHLVADLHGARVRGQRAAGGRGTGRPVHHPQPHAPPGEFMRHGQARRSAADDQHLDIRRCRARPVTAHAPTP